MKKSFKFKLLLGVLLFLAVALTVVDELVRYGIMSTYTRSIIWIVVSAPLWLPITFFILKAVIFETPNNRDDEVYRYGNYLNPDHRK